MSTPVYQKKIANSYKHSSLETASPGRLILMLYDGALRFMDQAIKGFDIKGKRASYEEVNNNIVRAIAIIAELRASLNHEVGGEFSVTMSNLYDYMEGQLSLGNVKKEVSLVEEARKHLQEIRDSWAEMLLKSGEKDKGQITSISCNA